MKIRRAAIVVGAALVAVWSIVGLLRPAWAGPGVRLSAHLGSHLGDVAIDEIAWGGTAANANHEWIELKNNTTNPIDLAGWSLYSSDGSPHVTLSGAIPPGGYYLLERSSDSVVSDIAADQLYSGNLVNSGEALTLTDSTHTVIDTANADGGLWPAGSGSPGYISMERVDPAAAGVDLNWAGNDGVTRNGLDANSNPINGTPKHANSLSGPAPIPVAAGSVLISAVHYDAYANGDEAFRLTNVTTQAIALLGWFATDGMGEGMLDLTGTLAAGQSIWIAKRAVTFTQQFGFKPDYEYDADTDPTVRDLTGSPPALGLGDELVIRKGASHWVDAVVWGAGQITDTGWLTGWAGLPVQRYSNGSIAGLGQILFRRLDESTGALALDTDTARDWANDSVDPESGRRPMYPGWDLESFWQTARVTATAWLTVAIAPDNAYRVISDLIGSARQSIRIEMYSFDNLGLLEALTRTMHTYGVSVTLLLEGDPVGGVEDQERWVCQNIQTAGGECWFMISDSAEDIRDRYDYLHAKMMIVDDRVVAIGSENFSPRSMPDDDPADGTLGQRGAFLVTDAPGVVGRALDIWRADFDPAHYRDIGPWGSDEYVAPPLGFTPVYTTGGSGYGIRFPAPLGLTAPLTFELLTSPENSLRKTDSLLGWIARAGPNDAIDVEQLNEPPHWGESGGNATDDPNLRLQALIDAALRGAHVRLLLDAGFDDVSRPTSNAATCAYVESLRALNPVLVSNFEVRRGNPTLGGLHSKLFLLNVDGHQIVHIGSLNGTETSSKTNREVALQVESGAAYDYVRAVFDFDWSFQLRAYLPVAFRDWNPPADHVLIGEVFYLGSTGSLTGSEWVQLYNPTPITVGLAGYKIGDEETKGGGGFGFDGMWSFPPSATLAPGQKVNIATTAQGFYGRYGYSPHFVFFNGVPGVTQMTPYLAWTPMVTFSLANTGDEIVLLGPADRVVDGVAWGTGSLVGNVSCSSLVPPPYASIERRPIDRDRDSCPSDFVVDVDAIP